MNLIRSLLRIVNAPRIMEEQSVLIHRLYEKIQRMEMDINTLDSSIGDFQKAFNEHDHDGDLASEDHDHGDDFAREDHEHDLNDQIASAVRLKLIASFDEIVSNL